MDKIPTPRSRKHFSLLLQACAPACQALNMQIPDVYLIRFFLFLEAICTHQFEL